MVGTVLGRFTPVRTGKSRDAPREPPQETVHPRAYGEEARQNDFHGLNSGSPPCVRGRE